MTTKHSPTPWHTEAACLIDAAGNVVASSSANARLIVRAVNSHDDLMAALRFIEEKARVAPGMMSDVALRSAGKIARSALAKAAG